MAATPIFILGRHRSGTTWLSNILASLPEIYVPTHERHDGVHESAFFSHLVRFCNHGRTESDLREIKRLFESSDFFALTGLTEGPEILGQGPAGYFRSVMEAAARNHGARFWLEKSPAHTLHAKFLAAAFPDARFFAVVRDYRAVVASNVHAFGEPRSAWSWFRHSLVSAVYEKVLARNRVPVVRYESLLSDYAGTVLSLLASLGIERGSTPQSAFRKNTFYEGAPPRREWWQSLSMAAGRGLIQALPAALVEEAVIRWRRRKPGILPPWFFPPGTRIETARPA
jgi:Sulfotransferase family